MQSYSPKRVWGKPVKNGVVFAPVVPFGIGRGDGMMDEETIAHYEKRAQGGAGIIILGATAVSPQGKLADNQGCIYSDAFLPGLSALAQAIKAHGALALVQIHHAGLRSQGDKVVGPSPLSLKDGRQVAQADPARIEADFVSGALRAQKAGFDGVELHCAHAYLLCQFLSADVNRRSDEYGGDLANRARLPLSVMRAIKSACGDGFIVGVRYGAHTGDEALALSGLFAAAGADYLHISSGMDRGCGLLTAPEGFLHSDFVYTASRVKAVSPVPVIAVNGIRTAAQADHILSSGYADFAAMARALLADERLPLKGQDDPGYAPCQNCKPCAWFSGGENCPAQLARRH